MQQQKKEADALKKKQEKLIEAVKAPTALFFRHNEALGPPYKIIVDTNFINFSIQNKLDLVQGMMDCLYAKCTPVILEAVMAELEKLGPKYRIALRYFDNCILKRDSILTADFRIAKDERFERVPTDTTYADDEIVKLVTQHRCYIVATCDRYVHTLVYW